MAIIKCGSLEETLKCISNAIGEKMDESKITQETKPAPVPHVHAAIISEWVKDTTRALQCRQGDDGKWITCDKPHWHANTQYRFKPRWFDMTQEWHAKGRPPVQFKIDKKCESWCDATIPDWNRDDIEYRFKEVSRHAALKAEWEAKGKPKMQVKSTIEPFPWMDMHPEDSGWRDKEDYRIKPTPHQSADVLRAVADNRDILIEIQSSSGAWFECDISKEIIRIKQ